MSVRGKDILLIGLGVTALYLFIPRVVQAARVGEVDIETVDLYPVSGANWTLPLYMTLERDVRFGIWDFLVDAGTTVANSLGTTALAVGDAISTAFTWGNNVLQGTVIPAVVNIGGVTADVLKTGAEWAWTGTKAVGGITYDVLKYTGEAVWTGTEAVGAGLGWVGGKTWDTAKAVGSSIWDTLTGANNPAVQSGKSESLLTKALAIVAATGASIYANKENNISNTSNNPETTTPNTIGGQTTSESILLGYSSKSNFEGALQLNKMYNPTIKDTLVMTDPEGTSVAQEAGYQLIANLGYCSPIAFENCVPLIRFFNSSTLDHLVVSNPEIGPSLEGIGYASQGCIGYIKAVS